MMIRDLPCDYKAYGRLADVLMKQGDPSEASDYYDIAASLDKSKKDMIQKAINLATESKWPEAALMNQNIIEDFPWDLDAFNRLGKAFIEMGYKNKASGAFKCALVISSNSVIAKKNLDRLNKINDIKKQRDFRNGIVNKSYIEESGKTTITKLVNVSRQLDFSNLLAGDLVHLVLSSKGIKINDQNENALGNLEPKIGSRLRRLVNGGNKYEANITSIDGKNISIIINEVFRSSSQANVPSFMKKSETMSSIPNVTIGYTLNDDSKFANMKDWTNDDTESGDEAVFSANIPEFISAKKDNSFEDNY
jgi:tetratricopeptide (TPR) repeat protein